MALMQCIEVRTGEKGRLSYFPEGPNMSTQDLYCYSAGHGVKLEVLGVNEKKIRSVIQKNNSGVSDNELAEGRGGMKTSQKDIRRGQAKGEG